MYTVTECVYVTLPIIPCVSRSYIQFIEDNALIMIK